MLNLTHLAVNRGSIYLAGGSILCQLDQDLLPSQTVGTDPLLDSTSPKYLKCSTRKLFGTNLFQLINTS